MIANVIDKLVVAFLKTYISVWVDDIQLKICDHTSK